MTTINAEQFEQMTNGDGSFHLSPMLIGEETKEVAQMMHENGATDEEIGKLLRHHVHDKDDEEGLSVMVFRHSKEPGIYGVSAFVPNSQWYDMFFADVVAQDDQPQARVKTYGVPNSKQAKSVIDNELVTTTWWENAVEIEGDFE